MKKLPASAAVGLCVIGAIAAGCTQTPTATSGTSTLTKEQYIEKGKYIAKIGTCAECHTGITPQGLDMANYMAGGRAWFLPGLGITVTSNLTTDFQNMTEQEAASYLKELKPLPPMPSLKDMTDEDLLALAYYMKSVAPIQHSVPKSWLFATHQQGDTSWPHPAGISGSTGGTVTNFSYDPSLPALSQSVIDAQIASASAH
ncbi:MAG TPA: hypothetical protein V6D05_15625 [Stenomitos sp.]